MTATFDVLALGIVTWDELLYVEAYPPVETKTRVTQRLAMVGGLAGNALVAATRYGARCAFAGVLGDDEPSRRAAEALAREGIDLRYVDPARRHGVLRSTIVVGTRDGSRTIFFEWPQGLAFGGNWPPDEAIDSTRVLLIDHHDSERMIRAARRARDHGIPVVADFERDEGPRFAELLAAPDHLIVSRRFALRITGAADPATAVAALHGPGRAITVVTAGEGGYWYSLGGEPNVAHRRAQAVQAVDTSGCGDAFHGVYAAALAEGRAIPDALHRASIAAALKATRPGTSDAMPTRAELDAYLARTEA